MPEGLSGIQRLAMAGTVKHGHGYGTAAASPGPVAYEERAGTAMRDYALEERTIGRILAEKAGRIPDKVFLLWQGRSYSYGEVEVMTNRYANGYAALGIGHGDHVAVILPNCPEFYWATWGLGKLGAIAVPINTAAKGDMLRYVIDQYDAT